MLRTWASDDRYLRAAARLARASRRRRAVARPRRMLGTITLASFSDRRFSDDDVRVVRELARRAAFAVDNARLYRETQLHRRPAAAQPAAAAPPRYPRRGHRGPVPPRRGQERRRRRLLRHLPDRAEPLGDHDRGRVRKGRRRRSGHGARAPHAARNRDPRRRRSPTTLLRALNDAMLVDNPTDFQFCTVAFAGLELRNGSTRLEVSSGGHPLPVVLRAGGEVESAGEPGTLLGVVPDPDPVVHRDGALPAATRWSSTRTGSQRRAPRRGCSATRDC